MPSELATAAGGQDLWRMIDELKRELSDADRREAATAEVLKVISRSPTNVQPVFDTIAQSVARLCEAHFSYVFRFDGQLIHHAASHGLPEEALLAISDRPAFPRPPGRGKAVARSILNGTVEEIPDILADPDYEQGPMAKVMGYRSVVAVPMLKDGRPIGAISMVRPQVGAFSPRQIELVRIFADQAVIAIENARLFEAEQASRRELQESLEYQTATSEVLNVISRSPTELQPVLDAIAATAARLCESMDALVWRVAGGRIRVAAQFGSPTKSDHPLTRGTVTGRAIVDRTTIHVHDLAAMVESEYPDAKEIQQRVGHRTTLATPLLSQGEALGAISVRKNHVHPFSVRQIALLQTFADQAVIAIENARLFEAEQTSKRELQESFDYQTAISEVLGVISRSPTQLQPIVDAIVQTAKRLCSAERAIIWRLHEGKFDLLANTMTDAVLTKYLTENPIPAGLGWLSGRAILSRRAMHVADISVHPELGSQNQARAEGLRTLLAVPLLREGEPIGALTLSKKEVQPFSEKQIELVTTFADQAVIAIENARLFEAELASKRELARSVEELESLGKVSQVVNSSLELDKVLPTILEHACAMSYAGGGTVYVFDKATSEFRLAAAHNMSDEHIAMVRAQPMRLNSAVIGECATRREVVQLADLSSAAPSPMFDILLRTGVRAVLAVPLLHQAEVVGVLVVRRNQPGTFSQESIRLVEAFAAQSAIAVENARLFGEIAQKSRELEIASQHKSQFVANMSHELRTPLAAILGYAELMQEGFYEPLGQKSIDALTRIRSNGKHLLGLINTVLDIAKIESGQFTLNMAEYDIESVVETVRSATESLAQNKKLALKTEVARKLPLGVGDEQRLTQVLLNLVGNAIKFTDGGEVRVTAKAVNCHFRVSVADTGPGIPEQEHKRIFEQFHQIDSSLTKAKGGTGLGLAIAKQIVEMHGGRIWVESTPGKGATFHMELPARAELRKSAP